MSLKVDNEAAARGRLIADRRASRIGRPKGSKIPLLQHSRRFETAIWFTLTKGFDIGPSTAANAAAAILSPRRIDAGTVQGVLLCLATGIDHATLRGRADRINRRAQAAVETASPEEMTWLIDSGAALFQLWVWREDTSHTAYVLETLRARGWGPTLAGIATRLEAALGTNLPPVSGPVPRSVQRLVDAIVAESQPRQ